MDGVGGVHDADGGRRAARGPSCGGASAKPSIRSASDIDPDRAGEETLSNPPGRRVGGGPPPAMETPQRRSSSLRRSAAARRSSRLARLCSESLRF